MINKKIFISELDKFVSAKVATGKTPCNFCLKDVLGARGLVLPGVWLYEAVVTNKRYANVYKSGHCESGNIYTIM